MRVILIDQLSVGADKRALAVGHSLFAPFHRGSDAFAVHRLEALKDAHFLFKRVRADQHPQRGHDEENEEADEAVDQHHFEGCVQLANLNSPHTCKCFFRNVFKGGFLQSFDEDESLLG